MDYLLIFVAGLLLLCCVVAGGDLLHRRADAGRPAPRVAVGLVDAVLHPHSYLAEQEACDDRR